MRKSSGRGSRRGPEASASPVTASQRLQIFNQIVPLFLIQHAADDTGFVRTRGSLERVAENTVAVDWRSVGVCRGEQGFTLVAGLRFIGGDAKADILRIEIARAHAELFGTLGR